MLNRAIPFCISLLLLGGMGAERWSLLPPKNAVVYHARVRAAADRVPLRFGPWVGKDVEVAADASRMLRPNVLISRMYRNLSSGTEVSFLFVQCPDARAIMDHYPPICYVTRGFNKDAAIATDWNVGPMRIDGTEYEFTRRSLMEGMSIVVDNFIVMPTGRIERDMEATKAAASDLNKRFFGAAQFQLAFDGGVSREERQEAFRAFVMASQPLIEAVQSGSLP